MTSLAQMKRPEALLDQTLDEAFPKVDPGEEPCGSLLLIQIKKPAYKTKGGIELTGNDQATEFDNTCVAKVLAMGPLAFHSRDTQKLWPEGRWVPVGAYIRISQHNAKTWTVPMPGTRGATLQDRVTFGYMDDLLIQGIVKDPLATKAFF